MHQEKENQPLQKVIILGKGAVGSTMGLYFHPGEPCQMHFLSGSFEKEKPHGGFCQVCTVFRGSGRIHGQTYPASPLVQQRVPWE